MRSPLETGGQRLEEQEPELKDTALIFVGQGTHFVGMGRDLYHKSPAARATFDEADKRLRQPLSRICFEGPEGLLNRSDISPLAILTVSTALFNGLLEKDPSLPNRVSLVAGHSAGEISASVAAEVIDFPTALDVMQKRSILTREAAQKANGAMVAVRMRAGEFVDFLKGLREEVTGRIGIAAVNSEEDFTLTGFEDAIQHVVEVFESMKIRYQRLKIDGAFHFSPVMESAQEGFRRFLGDIHFGIPKFDLVLNKDGQPYRSPEVIKHELSDNLSNPVQFVDTVNTIVASGAKRVITIGPKDALSAYVRKIAPTLQIVKITDLVSLQAAQI